MSRPPGIDAPAAPLTDRRLVELFLQAMEGKSNAEVEAETAVGHSSTHRWRIQVPDRLYPVTRRKVIATLVARGIIPADREPEGPTSLDFGDGPADDLIWAFSHPAVLATHSHLTRRQRIELVTKWAEEHPETYPDSELAKVYEWARTELSRDPGK